MITEAISPPRVAVPPFYLIEDGYKTCFDARTDQFWWNNAMGWYNANASDLGWPPGKFSDVIVLESADTGKRLPLVFFRDTRSGEAVVGWEYLCGENSSFYLRVWRG